MFDLSSSCNDNSSLLIAIRINKKHTTCPPINMPNVNNIAIKIFIKTVIYKKKRERQHQKTLATPLFLT